MGTFLMSPHGDIIKVARHPAGDVMSTDIRNVPLFMTLEMSPFVVVVHYFFSSSSRGCG
jgi:hypothetical protein